ncbi:MAG: hypothetical protein IH940_08480, partial [Acidobacteria bacterium]|nr:hypothetical protein [Acidobacteriota bacterium]
MRRFLSLCAVVAVVSAALVSVSPGADAASATYTVTNKSGANTPGSLRNAIIKASAAGNGTQTINIKVTGLIKVGSSLNYSGTGNLVINGNGITLDGMDNGRVLRSARASATTTLRNLTIKGGYTANQGGAILNVGDMTLDQVAITQSTAERGGGGIVHSDGKLSILRSKIIGNVATNDKPGDGIFNPNGGGVLAPTSLVKIEESLIQ